MSGRFIRACSDAAATAIGDPDIHILNGHGHLAIRTDPATVAKIVINFIR